MADNIRSTVSMLFFTLGMESSFSFLVSGGTSVQIGIDSHGRFNFSGTVYGGFKISPSFGTGRALIATVMPNLNNVKDLGGLSFKAGAHVDFFLFSVSGDAYVNIPNKLKKNGQAGISVSGGVQKRVKKATGGVHAYLSYTYTSGSYNIESIKRKKKYKKSFSFNKNKVSIFKSKSNKKDRIGIKINKKYTAYIYSKNRISFK